MLTTNDQHPLHPHQHPTAHSRGPHDTEQAPNCPRCASTNTKFCYYNNYSLSQPRYFCKACRRYWTKGGSLRNVPVGGSYRRRRRATSSSSKPRPHHDHGSPYSFTSGDNSTSSSSDSASSNVEIDLAAVFANYVNPGSCAKTQRPADLPDRAGFVGVDSPSMEESCFGLGMLQDELWCSSAEFANWEPMVDLRELDSPPLEPASGVGVALEDQLFQSDSMNQVMSDINWSCFDLEGYTSSFGN